MYMKKKKTFIIALYAQDGKTVIKTRRNKP